MSSSTDNTPSTPKAKLSDKQTELLAIVMQNVHGMPDVNWDNVATQGGYKTAASAKETFRSLNKKFGWFSGSSNTTPKGAASGSGSFGSGGPTPTKIQKTPAKRGRPKKTVAPPVSDKGVEKEMKAKAEAEADGDGDDGVDDEQDDMAI